MKTQVTKTLFECKHVIKCLCENFFLLTQFMGGGEEVNVRLMMMAIQEQFKALNKKLDDLQYTSRFRSSMQNTYEEKEKKYLNENTRRRRGGDFRRDNYLGNIKMRIPLFQGKNDLKLYLEWERNII